MKLKHFKKEAGQAMVEFALVLPILLLFIGGIIDFGWIFYNEISANNACREAARYVAIHYKIDPIEEDNAKAVSEATTKINENILTSFIMDSNSVKVDHKYEDDTKPDGGEYITVNLDGKIIVLTPILQTILGSKFGIDAKCTMRVEK